MTARLDRPLTVVGGALGGRSRGHEGTWGKRDGEVRGDGEGDYQRSLQEERERHETETSGQTGSLEGRARGASRQVFVFMFHCRMVIHFVDSSEH